MTVEIRDLPNAGEGAQARRAVTTPFFAARTQSCLRRTVASVFERLERAPPGAAERALAALTEFPNLYEERPVRDNQGGSGFNDSLWLFVLAHAFSPEWIIESGVHKGHSTWLFRMACPTARIFSFDIDLAKRIYIDEATAYFEHDWTQWSVPPDLDRARTLVFMDDHIDQARRILEVSARAFPVVLFDDNFPAELLHATGGPPVPTVSMIMDDALREQPLIEWTRNGKLYRYQVDMDAVQSARAAISKHLVLPDLAEITRYPLGSCLTVVQTVFV